jgi:hypothetical protein
MTDKNSFDFDSMGRVAYRWADFEEKMYPTKPKYQVRVFFPLGNGHTEKYRSPYK